MTTFIFCSFENLQRHQRAKIGSKAAQAFVSAEPQEAAGHRGQVEQLEALAVQAEEETAESGSTGMPNELLRLLDIS